MNRIPAAGDDPYQRELAVASEIAQQAGRLIIERSGRIGQIDFKGARDIVTDVDRESEELILAALQGSFPGDAWLAEESGPAGSGPRTWVVDPLDGTVNFANGIPIYCVSLGLVVDGRPVAGVIYDPVRDETISATETGRACLNGLPVGASRKERLEDYVISLTLDLERLASRGAGLNRAVRVHRRLGSSALALAWVGCGRFDGFVQTENLSPWDVAAAGLIAERAGARVERVGGGSYVDLGLGSSRYGVIAAPEPHFSELRRLAG
ncbi:MAG: inositol monophosphatase family protein [Candidatus Limnocylindrales bacterium]